VASIFAVRALRADENPGSSWLGEAVSEGGGTSQFLSLLDSFGQSASCQRGLGLSLWGDGGCKVISMGVWLDPVEGRVDASHERKAGKIYGLAKAMSMALGLWVPLKGNRVYTPGVLTRVKPRSEAGSK